MIRLDEPFPTPMGDPRSNLDLLRVALKGLKDRRYPDIDPDLLTFPQGELVFTLRHGLALQNLEPINGEVTDAISLPLYCHSVHMGRTAAENLTRVSDMMFTSDYGSAHNMAMRRGDVRELAADAVVSVAMLSLLGCKDPLRLCIDNYIQGQGSPRVHDDCSIIHEIQGKDQEASDAAFTHEYCLPARYVLHIFGPHLDGGEITDKDCEKFVVCCTPCLDLAPEKGGIHNISFCMFSTDHNNFPSEETTHIALDIVNQRLQYHGTDAIELVILSIFGDVDTEEYIQAFESWVES